ncbi:MULTISPECIES: DUF2523 family protein [Marinobacter]|uniref:DUF2523 family protein n=1 Tax=Marinobacter TaxID=2742 RepID=UPI000D0E36FD|nr:DUF2523 family protein [Marinobacter shengliensis]PSF14799.1 hypothetical protein C7H10_03685 [Marinobacter shengliensis]WBU40652.1 DUF2523 family protein [Marinobacter alkaliphilus]
MEFIANFFDSIWIFFESLSDFATDILVKVSAWYVIWVTKAKIYFVGFSWEVAQEVLNQLNISATINQYWGSIDSKVMGALTFFKIPEALNIILNAHLTRYVMGVFK